MKNTKKFLRSKRYLAARRHLFIMLPDFHWSQGKQAAAIMLRSLEGGLRSGKTMLMQVKLDEFRADSEN